MIETCTAFGVLAGRRDGHPGAWCDPDGPEPRKIGALGIRVERGVTFHGIALNVDPDLGDFELIDACGMPDVRSTSIAAEGGTTGGPEAAVAGCAAVFAAALARHIGADLAGRLPPHADPGTERASLGSLLATPAAVASPRERAMPG
jgi:lipoyl(octanoyl) transferase